MDVFSPPRHAIPGLALAMFLAQKRQDRYRLFRAKGDMTARKQGNFYKRNAKYQRTTLSQM